MRKDKWDKLLELLDEEEFIAKDLLAIVCSHLVDNKDTDYKAALTIGGKFFEIEIKKREIQ